MNKSAAEHPTELSSWGAIASIIGVMLAFVSVAIPLLISINVIKDSTPSLYIIFVNFALLLALFFFGWRLAKTGKKLAILKVKTSLLKSENSEIRDKYLRALRGIENVARERTGVTDFLIDSFRRKGPSVEVLLHRSSAFVSLLLTHAKEIFDVHTGQKCSVCIKILIKHDPYDAGQKEGAGLVNEVKTLKRDDASSAERSAAAGHDREAYAYTHNTAFKTIYQAPSSDGFWFSNDLEAMGADYENGHENWRRYYNAAAVMAIRKPSDYNPEFILGFLCVDNQGGGFDQSHTRYILSCLAHTLYYVLSGIAIIKKEDKG